MRLHVIHEVKSMHSRSLKSAPIRHVLISLDKEYEENLRKREVRTTLRPTAKFLGYFLFSISALQILTEDSGGIVIHFFLHDTGNVVDSQQTKERAARARSSEAQVRDRAYPGVSHGF